MTAIGRPLPRREDARFLTGQGRYLDDMGFAGPLREPIVSDADGHHVTGSLMDDGIATGGFAVDRDRVPPPARPPAARACRRAG